MININSKNIDTFYNPETKNAAIVVSDGLNAKATIINKDGVIVKQEDCGFNHWSVIIVAAEYLSTFERYCDQMHEIALEKLNEKSNKPKV